MDCHEGIVVGTHEDGSRLIVTSETVYIEYANGNVCSINGETRDKDGYLISYWDKDWNLVFPQIKTKVWL